MKKILLTIAFVSFLGACTETEEKSVKDELNNAANNVNTQLKKLDNAAKKHTAEFSEQVKENSKGAGEKAGEVITKMDNKANELIDKAAGKDSSD